MPIKKEDASMDTLRDAFLRKYPKNEKVLSYFEEANGVPCTWENLSKVRLQTFVNYMSDRMSPNSAKTYCAKFKSVLNSYNEEVTLPRDHDKVLQVRKDTSQNVYLSLEDIDKLRGYVPRTKGEEVIKNRFLLGCVTGARHSDYERFTQNNIQDGELKYVSIKTHTDTSVPLSPLAKAILEENDEKHYNDVSISESYFNRALRRMCKSVGICEMTSLYHNGKFNTKEKYKYVASHTARRSFATNLYKAGVDIYTISRLCGHSSVEMTKKYICCPVQIPDQARSFFASLA